MSSFHTSISEQPRRSSIENKSVDALVDPGDRFLRRVSAAANHVLGDSEVGRQVRELCDDHADAREMILVDRNSGATVIAIVGATGQGKSWLIRQFVRRSPIAANIRSGNNLDEATEKLIWIGPQPPADLDSRTERYLPCETNMMEPIGVPYMLVDAPGSTDDRRTIATVATRALSLASVIFLVVRRDQIRSQAVGVLTEATEGTLVVPIVNAIRQRDAELDADIDTLVSKMRRAAVTSTFAPPVLIDDFELKDRDENTTGELAATAIASRLKEQLTDGWDGDRRKSTRLAATDARFKAALQSILREHLPGLTGAVTRLNNEAVSLPGQVAESLVGAGGPLRAVIRSRLRAALLTETLAIWFPYRSLMGVLNLTHGAWDRVALSLSGSLPSLIGAAWTSAQNLRDGHTAEQTVRDGLRMRSAAAVADRLGPLAARFRDELAQLRREPRTSRNEPGNDSSRSQVAYLAGIDTLQERSQAIFEEVVDRVAVGPRPAFYCGLAGTAIFWCLLGGPIVTLYRKYFDASMLTLSEFGGDLEAYPHPTAAMMLTSILLSLLPLSIFSMFVVSWAQSRDRVEQAAIAIRNEHRKAIRELQAGGVLALRWDDPLLADAEFLLSAGSSGMETES